MLYNIFSYHSNITQIKNQFQLKDRFYTLTILRESRCFCTSLCSNFYHFLFLSQPLYLNTLNIIIESYDWFSPCLVIFIFFIFTDIFITCIFELISCFMVKISKHSVVTEFFIWFWFCDIYVWQDRWCLWRWVSLFPRNKINSNSLIHCYISRLVRRFNGEMLYMYLWFS